MIVISKDEIKKILDMISNLKSATIVELRKIGLNVNRAKMRVLERKKLVIKTPKWERNSSKKDIQGTMNYKYKVAN